MDGIKPFSSIKKKSGYRLLSVNLNRGDYVII